MYISIESSTMARRQDDDDTTLLLHHVDAKDLNAMESLRPEEKRAINHHGRTTVICGVCQYPLFWPEGSSTAKCPYCSHINYLTAARYWGCASCWLIAAVLVFAIAAGVVAGTVTLASKDRGIIVAWTGLFAAGFMLMIRGCVYCCRPFCMTKGTITTQL